MSTRIVTGEVRLSFVNVFEPRAAVEGAEAKYSVTILLPKSDTETKARLDAAIEAAKQQGKNSNWNGVIPPTVPTPIHDGDGVKPSDGMPFGEECKGHWVFTASAKEQFKPEVVDAQLNPIINQSEIYSGCYGRVSVNFFPYSFGGRKGIGAGLGNIQKTRDGEPLAGRTSAADDFGAFKPVNSDTQNPFTAETEINPITGLPM